MSSKLVYQVIRNAANRWLIWEIGEGFDTPKGQAREYEEVARVVEDTGLFYVEIPKWSGEGIEEWERQPRGWLTKSGAVRSVTHPKKAMAS